ncbi:MAG: hypothetical protein JWP10_1629, partial [Nocardioidaceae bacterium]|nr:hypothetical protein [Nocardioidaceae bacterium]
IVVYGRYFDEYVRTSDGWKFRKTRFVNDTRTGVNP